MMAFLLPMAVALVSCNSDDPEYSNPFVSVGDRSISFETEGGSVTFDVTANRTWSVTSSESWLVASPNGQEIKNGKEVTTTVTLTAAANADAARSANLTISSAALPDPIVITVSQKGDGTTSIAAIMSGGEGVPYTANGTVAAVTTQGFVLVDNTAGILVYMGEEPGVVIGDKVTVSGTSASYNGLIQFGKDGLSVEKTGHDDAFAPVPAEITANEFSTYENNLTVKYVKMAGKFSFSDSGKGYNYYNFNMTGSSAKGSFSYVPEALVEGFANNSDVIIEGYLIGANTSHFIQIALVKMEIDDNAPEQPEPEESTIAEVIAGQVGGSYKVNGTVAAVTTQSFVLVDQSASILVFKGSDPGLVIGDQVTVAGSTSTYAGLTQFGKDGLTVEKTGHDNTFAPVPTEITADEFTNYKNNRVIKYVKMAGEFTFSDSGRGFNYYNFNMTGSSAKGSFSYAPEDLVEGFANNSAVIVEGYLIGVNDSDFTQIALVKMTADSGTTPDPNFDPDPDPDQPADVNTVAEVYEGAKGEQFTVAGTVAAVTLKSFIVVDNTGALNIYTNALPAVEGTELKIGDNVTITGTRDEYSNVAQLASPVVSMRDGNSYTLPTASEIDAAGLDAYIDNPVVKKVKVAGTYSVSGSYVNLNVEGLSVAAGGSFYQLPSSILGDITSGTPVIVEGFLVGYNGGKFINIHATKMEKDSSVPDEPGGDSGVWSIMTQAPADYSGTYFIAIKNNAGAWKMLSGVNSNQGIATDITVSAGKFEPTGAQVDNNTVVIEKVAGKSTYTVKLGGKYLYWSSGNSLYASADVPASNYEWTISGAGENGVEMSLADAGRYLYFNETATNGRPFRCYVPKTTGAGTDYHLMTFFEAE